MTWVELSVNPNYEMLTEYPYYVRNKRTKRTLTPQVNRTLYSYRLQNKRYYTGCPRWCLASAYRRVYGIFQYKINIEHIS